MNKTAWTILADGFEEVEAITPIDLLRRAGIEVTVLGLSGREIKGSHSIIVKTDASFSLQGPLPDAVILPGGPGHKNLLNSAAVIEFVQKMFQEKRLCAAICAAPSVFGKAGILMGKKATCFPGYEDKLANATFVDVPVVTDGTVITSRGAGTAVPFSLEIIGYLMGSHAAESVASTIIYKP